jgi:Ca2+-transporting ATPase
MSGQVINMANLRGLEEADIIPLRQKFGKNIFNAEKPRRLLHIIRDTVLEPMFILLAVACILYIILDEIAEGMMVMAAMLLVAGIALYQDVRSTRALKALREFTAPKVTVIRNGTINTIGSEELVPGDLLLLEEGNTIPADATIVQANDFTINESIITGESFPVEKQATSGYDMIYQGTTVNSGKCYAIVAATGNNTVLGELGKSISAYSSSKTLLQKQVNLFVSRLAFFGLIAFVLIWLINYLNSDMLVQSILFALTLAMAAIPEEIPVAFSSFMALGAWQMSKLGIISRQPQTIENLGSVNVICLDKTGTLTENKMTVTMVYDFDNDKLTEPGTLKRMDPIGYAMLASEREPFDAMEVAIHDTYQKHANHLQFDTLSQIYEYPLQGAAPMMTHIYQTKNYKIAAAKGAPERILSVCHLDDKTMAKVTGHINSQAEKGHRIIGVASAIHNNEEFPLLQDDYNWKFEGFICLSDPPKENGKQTLQEFYRAKIDIKLLTGDYPKTAVNIAGQVGINNYSTYLTGEQVMLMKDQELNEAVTQTNIFARMFPEAKLRVINSLKSTGQIVAMTGDGVNDAPALQASHIGIAMGKKGTEIAKQAADLIITDDNLEKLVEAIRQGRKIFNNLKKAVRYIISIHIPIILTASLPIIFGWAYPNIFSPIHIIFLELIMGPTCSVFFEKEPGEENMMSRPPRKRNVGLFEQGELLISITQGLIITAGVLCLYYVFMKQGRELEEVRTVVFTTLLFSNIFLTFANRSFTENIFITIRYKNSLVPWVLFTSLLFISGIHLIGPVRNIFGMVPISFSRILGCSGVAFISVMWFEMYKTHLYKPGHPTIRHNL